MKYEIRTYQGLVITPGPEFNPSAYLETLNNNRVEAVAIGSVSTIKHNIKSITTVYEESETPEGEVVLIYSVQNQDPTIARVVGFDSGEPTQKMNDRVPFIQIGDIIINRNEYNLVMPQQ